MTRCTAVLIIFAAGFVGVPHVGTPSTDSRTPLVYAGFDAGGADASGLAEIAPKAIPSKPTNLSPGSTNSPGPTLSSRTVTLDWSSSSGATHYDLGVRDMETGNLVVDTQPGSSSYTVTLGSNKPYRWNVAACNNSGCSSFTSPLYFQTPGSVPSTPTNLSPGSTSSPGPTLSSRTVTLDWSSSSGATHYDLGVRDQSTGQFVVEAQPGSSSYTVSLSAGKPYKWDVAACNNSGCSSYATDRYFQTPAQVPSISNVSPNPVTGSSSPQPFTIFGSNFVSGPNVTLRDHRTGEVFPNRAISSFSSSQITINPNFTTAAAAWSVEVINPDGQSSGQFFFQVQAPAQPSISNVSPNPVTGSSSPQPFAIFGSNFVSGPNVTLRDHRTGEVFPNRAISSFSSSQITINPIFTTIAATWSVEIINPNGQSSGQFVFEVQTPAGQPEIRIEPLSLEFSPPAGVLDPNASSHEVFESGINTQEFLRSQAETLGRLLAKAEREGSVDVIVGLDVDHVSEGKLAQRDAVINQRTAIAAAQAQVLQDLASLDPTILARFKYIPFLALRVGPAALAALSAFPEITSLEEDVAVPPLMESSNLVIGSPTAWTDGFTGSGQAIAVLDSGVDKTHPAFSTGGNKVISEACYSTPDGPTVTGLCPGGVSSSTAPGSGVNCPTTLSSCDHGTHVAGSAAGDDGSGPNFGVARGADIIAIQVFRRYSSAADCSPKPAPCIKTAPSDYIQALERVYDLRTTFNIAAVNMSFGGDPFSSEATCDASNLAPKAAIDNLRSVGIAGVAAAGNDDSRNGISAPACISSVVSVGATTDADAVADFSNVAPFVSLLAPGVSITSAVPGTGTRTKKGTSMASPHVAGAWAILKQADPSLTVDVVLAALRDTGTSVDDNRTDGTVTDMRRINLNLALDEVVAGLTKSFTIHNDGEGTLSVTSIQLETPASWIVWSPEAPFAVAPNSSQAVAVTVDSASAQAGTSSRRLLVASNDSNESPYPGGVFVNVEKPGAGAPDLIVADIGLSETTPKAGQSIMISATVRNQGNADAAPTTLRYYRSSDSTISSADIALSSDGVPELAPGASDPESEWLSIGIPGTYWIGACVETVSGETDTSNNCSAGSEIEVVECTAQTTLVLDHTSLDADQTYEACETIILGPNLTVTADIVVRAGMRVVFRDPVSVLTGANLSVYIETP